MLDITEYTKFKIKLEAAIAKACDDAVAVFGMETMHRIRAYLALTWSIVLVCLIAGIGLAAGVIYGLLASAFSAGRNLFL